MGVYVYFANIKDTYRNKKKSVMEKKQLSRKTNHEFNKCNVLIQGNSLKLPLAQGKDFEYPSGRTN